MAVGLVVGGAAGQGEVEAGGAAVRVVDGPTAFRTACPRAPRRSRGAGLGSS